jgi:hypothetical protein
VLVSGTGEVRVRKLRMPPVEVVGFLEGLGARDRDRRRARTRRVLLAGRHA